jgi:hypothetical protein
VVLGCLWVAWGGSGAEEARVEGAREADVGSALDESAAIGEGGDGVGLIGEAKEHAVGADLAQTGEAKAQGFEVKGTVMFVYLHGVTAAESDVGAVEAGEVTEVSVGADVTVGIGGGGGDLGALVGPEVVGDEGPPHEMRLAGEEFEGLGDLKGGGEVDGSGEDAGGVAGFDVAGWGGGEDAAEAGSREQGVGSRGGCVFQCLLPAPYSLGPREDVHGGGVGADGGGIDPRAGVADGEVVEEIAGFEVVGAVEDEVNAGEQGLDVGRDEVGDVGGEADGGVDASEVTAGGFGFGEGLEGVVFVEEHLALEIGGFDEVAVDEGEVADAGAGEEAGGGGSGGSNADDGDVAEGEALLAEGPDAGEENLARVAGLVGDGGGRGAGLAVGVGNGHHVRVYEGVAFVEGTPFIGVPKWADGSCGM